MSNRDFQRFRSRDDAFKAQTDEEGFIPTPGIVEVKQIRLFWFCRDDLQVAHLIGEFKRLIQAQDALKAFTNGSNVYRGQIIDHYLIVWLDSLGENHYQRWSNDYTNCFSYGESYARARYESEGAGLAVQVDPPIGSLSIRED